MSTANGTRQKSDVVTGEAASDNSAPEAASDEQSESE